MNTSMTATIVATMLTAGLIRAQQPDPEPLAASRFMPVAVYIDSKDQPLAAWQLEFGAVAGDVKIVGIEGGEHPAYRDPPYYDPQAMQHERVIIADFSTAPRDELPAGKTRIATIHVMITGDVQPQYQVELTTAATTNGKQIPADITIDEGASCKTSRNAM